MEAKNFDVKEVAYKASLALFFGVVVYCVGWLACGSFGLFAWPAWFK